MAKSFIEEILEETEEAADVDNTVRQSEADMIRLSQAEERAQAVEERGPSRFAAARIGDRAFLETTSAMGEFGLRMGENVAGTLGADAMEEWFRKKADQQRMATQEVRAMFEDAGALRGYAINSTFDRGISQGVGTLAEVVSVGALTGGKGIIPYFMAKTYEDSYQSGLEMGLDEDQARAFGVQDALWEGLPMILTAQLGLPGLEAVGKTWSAAGKKAVSQGIRQAALKAGANTVAELSEEYLTALGQELNAWAASGEEPTPEEIQQQVQEIAISTLVAMGGGEAIRAVEAANTKEERERLAELHKSFQQARRDDLVGRMSPGFRGMQSGAPTEAAKETPQVPVEEEAPDYTGYTPPGGAPRGPQQAQVDDEAPEDQTPIGTAVSFQSPFGDADGTVVGKTGPENDPVLLVDTQEGDRWRVRPDQITGMQAPEVPVEPTKGAQIGSPVAFQTEAGTQIGELRSVRDGRAYVQTDDGTMMAVDQAEVSVAPGAEVVFEGVGGMQVGTVVQVEGGRATIDDAAGRRHNIPAADLAIEPMKEQDDGIQQEPEGQEVQEQETGALPDEQGIAAEQQPEAEARERAEDRPGEDAPEVEPAQSDQPAAPKPQPAPQPRDQIASEQEPDAEAVPEPAAKPQAKPKPKKGKLAEPAAGPDILNVIQDEGGISTKPADYAGGEYDAQPAPGRAKSAIMSSRSTMMPDQMAQILQGYGIGDGTADTMWQLVREAEQGREAEDRQAKQERDRDREGRAQEMSPSQQARAQRKAKKQADRQIDEEVEGTGLSARELADMEEAPFAPPRAPGDTGPTAVREDGQGYDAGRRIPFATYFSGVGTVEAVLGDLVDGVVAVEYKGDIADAYEAAHGRRPTVADVRDVDPAEIRAADAFHASPVCKNFSAAKIGRKMDPIDVASADAIIRGIREGQPTVFTLENAPAYRDTVLFDRITNELDRQGYNWDAGLYDSKDYGGNSRRNRLILRAVKKGKKLPPIPQKESPADWYVALKPLLDQAPVDPDGMSNWEMRRFGWMAAKGQIDMSKPIISMGGSTNKETVNAVNAGEPAPVLKATPKEVVRVLFPDGTVKRVDGEMMKVLMNMPPDMPIPANTNKAKLVLGNGVQGVITEKLIAPAVALAEPGPTRVEDVQRGYHGTGNQAAYDRLSTEYVGGKGGEGAQAFGWGVYISSSEKIGKGYRDKLSQGAAQIMLRGEPLTVENTTDLERAVAARLFAYTARGNDIETAIYEVGQDLENEAMRERAMREKLAEEGEDSDWAGLNKLTEKTIDDRIERIYDMGMVLDLSGHEFAVSKPEGRLYDVEVPESNELLQYDKKITKQSKEVREKLKPLMRIALEGSMSGMMALRTQRGIAAQIEAGKRDPKEGAESIAEIDRELEEMQRDMTGNHLYHALTKADESLERTALDAFLAEHPEIDNTERSDKVASMMLKAVGIDGLEYPAGTISGGRTKARNFVIWNDDAMEIKRVRESQTVYHGSGNPNRITRLSTDYIGGPGGQGAQMRGWGIYLTNEEDIATFYREDNARKTDRAVVLVKKNDGTFRVGRTDGAYELRMALGTPGGWVQHALNTVALKADQMRDASISEVIAELRKDLEAEAEYADSLRSTDAQRKSPYGAVAAMNDDEAIMRNGAIDKFREVYDWVQNRHESTEFDVRGRLYDVEIPESADLLQWDAKVTSLQGEARVAAEMLSDHLRQLYLDELMSEVDMDGHSAMIDMKRKLAQERVDQNNPKVPTGRELYQAIASQHVRDPAPLRFYLPEDQAARITTMRADEAASHVLNAIGIPGLEFAAGEMMGASAASTYAKKGSRNFVIWNDSAMEIKRVREEGGYQQQLFSYSLSSPTMQSELPYRATDQAKNDPRIKALLVDNQSIELGIGDSVSALVKGYTEDQIPAFNFNGATVNNFQDAAVAFASLRSPYVERLAWMVVDKNGVVRASSIYSVGTIDGADVPVSLADFKPFRDALLEAGDGSTLWVSHNHPTGDPGPSQADRRVYNRLRGMAEETGHSFAGIITNGKEFTVMDGKGYEEKLGFAHEQDRGYEKISFGDQSAQISSPNQAADFAKLIQTDPDATVVIYTNVRSVATGVKAYSAIDGATLQADMDAFGASGILITSGNVAAINAASLDLGNLPRAVLDVIYISDEGESISLRKDRPERFTHEGRNQVSEDDRYGYRPESMGRVQPAPLPPGADVPVRPLRQSVDSLADDLGATVAARKKLKPGAAGYYMPGTAGVIIPSGAGLDVVAHELVGHWTDDRLGVLADYTTTDEELAAAKDGQQWAKDAIEEQSALDQELSRFWVFGSSPQPGMTPAQAINYQRGEGMAEYMRALIINPEAAREVAPLTTELVMTKLPNELLERLNQFGMEVRAFFAAPGHEKAGANIRKIGDLSPSRWQQATDFMRDLFNPPKGRLGKPFKVSTRTYLSKLFLDRLAPLVSSIRWLGEQRNISPKAKRVEDMLRLLQGTDDKMHAISNLGIVKADWLTTEDGKPAIRFAEGVEGGIDWLAGWVDATSMEAMERDLTRLDAYMVAQGVIEDAANIDADRAAMIEEANADVRAYADQLATVTLAAIRKLEVEQGRRVKGLERLLAGRIDQINRAAQTLAEATDADLANIIDVARELAAVQESAEATDDAGPSPKVLDRANKALDRMLSTLDLIYNRSREVKGTSDMRQKLTSLGKRIGKVQDQLDQGIPEAIEKARQEVETVAEAARNAMTQMVDEKVSKVRTRLQRRTDTLSKQVDKLYDAIDKGTAKIERETERKIRDLIKDGDRRVANKFRAVARLANRQAQRDEIRKNKLAGIGSDLIGDVAVANSIVRDLMHDPVLRQRLDEGARRYRLWADGVLRYMVDKGRLSEESYTRITQRHQFYVAMNRELDEQGFAPIGGGKVGSTKEVVKGRKGSQRTIANPIVSLIERTAQAVTEADRNEVMREIVDMIQVPRGMYKGQAPDTASVAVPVEEGSDGAVKVFRNGEPEFWKFTEKDLEDSIKGISEQYKLPVFLTALPAFTRNAIVNNHVFATLNTIRDTFHRMQIGEGDLKGPADEMRRIVRQMPYSRKRSEIENAIVELSGSAFTGHYMRGKENWDREIQQRTAEMVKGNSIVVTMRKMAGLYKRSIESSEFTGRSQEFWRLYEDNRRHGMDEMSAMIGAAASTRGLIDFAQSGTVIGVINQMIPFLNARIQGLRATGQAFKRNPTALAGRWAMYSMVPSLLAYAFAAMQGDDELEEYMNLPAWRRDLFWNFKVADDWWLSIPKPHELGAIGTLPERLVQAGHQNAKGEPDAWARAFKGHWYSLAGTLSPIDEGVLFGTWKVFGEMLANRNTFSGQMIVPFYEEDMPISMRKGTRHASRIGKAAQWLSGDRVDARMIDHLLRGTFGRYGSIAQATSDLGREDKKVATNRFVSAMTGILRGGPGAYGVDVELFLDREKEAGRGKGKAVKDLQEMRKRYYEASTAGERADLAREMRRYARGENPLMPLARAYSAANNLTKLYKQLDPPAQKDFRAANEKQLKDAVTVQKGMKEVNKLRKAGKEQAAEILARDVLGGGWKPPSTTRRKSSRGTSRSSTRR